MTDNTPDIKTVLGAAKGRNWRRITLIGTLCLGAVALSGWLWLARSSDTGAALYETQAVTRADLTVTVTATGTVEPTNEVEISSEISGTLRAVNVDFNDTVTVGQVLAQLDTDKLEASLAHSRATLEARLARVAEAEATVAETHAQYERVKELVAKNAATVQSLQAAEAAHARAEAGLAVTRADAKVAEADLKTEETNLTKACICSPINGVVLDRKVAVGQIVAASLQAPVLFTIAEDLRQMDLWVDIDEADVGTVTVGQNATFSVEAYQGRSFPAKIAGLRYAPQTVDGVVTYKAVLAIDNADLSLRPGMTATAEITVAQVAQALLVPNAALRFAPPDDSAETGSGGGLLGLLIPRRPAESTVTPAAKSPDGTRTIWVLRDAVPVPVQVTLGPTDGQMTQVTAGDLAEGDLVITALAVE